MNDTVPAGAPFFEQHREGLRDFWTVYAAHYDRVQDETMVVATAHPEFGPLVRAMPPERAAEQNRRSRALLERAIVDGEWVAYTADLREQGALYAKIGVSFGGWYDVIRAFQRVIVPLLVEAYIASPGRLSGALVAMLEFIDHAMATIAIEYVEAKQEERLRHLLDSVHDYAIFRLDPNGCIASWNAGARAIKQWEASEILGKHFSIFYSEEDRAAGLPEHEIVVATRDGRYEQEGWRYRKDGSRFWANVVITRVDGAGGALVGFAKVTRDLTQRKNADDALLRAKREVELANQELEAFSYSVAHDLRAPLRGINGFSRAVVEDWGDKLDAQGRDYLARIGAAARTMGGLIDALLALSRVSRAELRQETVSLTDLARDVAGELRAAHPERTVDFVVQDGLVAQGDPRLLRTMLENLLGNAWKFTQGLPAARIAFGLEVDGDEAAYFVKDDGAGFDMAYAGKLFAPFQRLHTRAEFAGSGIGLATVQRIVRRHGGRIWAHSAPDAGATFRFTLSGDVSS